MTLMFQREVALKIFDPSDGRKNRGSLAALGRNYMRVHVVAEVEPSAFKPPPKVHGTVLGFRRVPSPRIPFGSIRPLRALPQVVFFREEKTTSQCPLEALPEESRVGAALDSLKLDGRVRAEAVPPEGLGTLYLLFEGVP